MIRSATRNDAAALTRISFDSKGYWRYPQSYFEIWKNELTISPDYIDRNEVFVYEKNHEVVGYYSIVSLPEDAFVSGIRLTKGFWLEHMFIDPPNMGKGIGSKMFHHLRNWCKKMEIGKIEIFADPNSRAFYEKMGCRYVGEFPSTIKNRTTPYLRLQL